MSASTIISSQGTNINLYIYFSRVTLVSAWADDDQRGRVLRSLSMEIRFPKQNKESATKKVT